METLTVPCITAYQAQAPAGGYLGDHLPDRFCAGRPLFDPAAHQGRMPVLLSYPVIGPVGQAGEILVSAGTETVLSSTSVEQMKAAALLLYEQHRDAIEAAFSRAGNT
ncbi:MAG: hypothetical protein ACKV2V_07150 [Blastocatellia bacterium]